MIIKTMSYHCDSQHHILKLQQLDSHEVAQQNWQRKACRQIMSKKNACRFLEPWRRLDYWSLWMPSLCGSAALGMERALIGDHSTPNSHTTHMRVHQTFGETRLPLHQQPENVYNQKTKCTFSHQIFGSLGSWALYLSFPHSHHCPGTLPRRQNIVLFTAY